MNLGEAIRMCQLHMRRDTWIEENDWRALLNSAAMKFASVTGALASEFDLTLMTGVKEYALDDPVDGRMYRLLEDPVLDGQRITRIGREALYRQFGGDLTMSGTPTHVYPISSFSVGVYPIPDSQNDGRAMTLYGLYYPNEITAEYPLADELPFDAVDHQALVIGALIAAERIDGDIVVSRELKDEYLALENNARTRMKRQMPGTTRMVRGGR